MIANKTTKTKIGYWYQKKYLILFKVTKYSIKSFDVL